MGHIELVSPVAHIWYVKRTPSHISILLDISVKNLERVVYCEAYVVIDSGKVPELKRCQILTESEYLGYKEKYGQDSFKAGMGAEAIKILLKELDLDKLIEELKVELEQDTSLQKRRKLTRRIEVCEAFKKSGNKPEWMILDVLPVIPPELRPMVQLDGGRFATSDLNDLYRRVINRNNRLQRLLELKAPDIIIRNEKRMLQEAVDALFDNGRRGKPVRGHGNRPLKSLSDMLKGKQGRFRQNLLGKRVDYSGRSVIVVDPKLKLHQCGLPKRMALELFKPFLIRRLIMDGLAHNIKSANRMIESRATEVWDILEEVISEHPVLLNRAPTLHRIGIQAFEPVLVEGDAIKIHPLVCPAFNADFDGDQMAIHIPLSLEAQLEAKVLMLSSRNILSPANGKPLAAPTQDMVLGLCYLTKVKKGDVGEGNLYSDINEVLVALDKKRVGLHAWIKVKINGKVIETTPGRLIFNESLPDGFDYINETLSRKKCLDIISYCYRKKGLDETVEFLDRLKELGFKYATVYAASISMEDIKIPEKKDEIIAKVSKQVEEIIKQYQEGIITAEERYNRIVDLWTWASETVAEGLFRNLEKDKAGFNSVYIMMDSGARGSRQQVSQLGGVRGLMAKPSGEIIELPITSNFREGLNVLEYFISTHGARKGLADTALKTADAGYLTRRLVDVAQDVIITEEDCGTMNGVIVQAIREGDEVIESLGDRVLGRVALDDIVDPMTGEVIVEANSEINEDAVEKIEEAEIERVRIRTVLTCESKDGVCARCYGRDLATGQLVNIGEAVGIIAAQSIGEPGTQLTMRTFHIGGTAFRQVEEKELKFEYPVEVVETPKRQIPLDEKYSIVSRHGNVIVRRILDRMPLSENIQVNIFDGLWVNPGDKIAVVKTEEGEKEITAKLAGICRVTEKEIFICAKERVIPIKTGAKMLVKEGQILEPGEILAEFDPFNEPILTEVSGVVKFKDIVNERTVREELDENTGFLRRVIIEDKEGTLQPSIIISQEGKNPVTYYLPHGARIMVDEGQYIKAGDTIAKFPRELMRTKDITGGLPRVAELFEARRVKDAAYVSEIDGVVRFKGVKGAYRIIDIENEATKDVRTYPIPISKHLKVHDGDHIAAGDPLTEGSVDPHDILRIKGDKRLEDYLESEIQEVYRLQGVNINDKHIEIIIRQMLKKTEITDPGDTKFLIGEKVSKIEFLEENERVRKAGGRPAQGKSVLLGITKASLATESFISAASFQETTRILSDAAVQGKIDNLKGLKENVIIGRLIPAGTGMNRYRKMKIALKKEEDVHPAVEETEVEKKEEFTEAPKADAQSDYDVGIAN
jgi:DNA-directed RNA polymerase subunit beta'